MGSVERRVAPGQRAAKPTDLPPRGWWQVVRRAFVEARDDNVPILAGGVAYFAFLALFPALIAAVSTFGLVADPQQVTDQVGDLTAVLPESARPLITEQLASVGAGGRGGLGLGLVVSVLAALWSASGGMMNLIKAVNLAYDEQEDRGFLRLRAIALGMTLGAMVVGLLALGLVAVLPVVFDAVGLGGPGLVVAQVLRWVLLVVLVLSALAVCYRVAPDRDPPRFAWASVGAVVATVLWLVGSVAFSLYVDNFGSYNKTYGALAGVIVLLLWLYLTSYIVLLGAEINAEAERQTERDTTRGPARRRGTRHAVAADDLAAAPD